MNYHQFFELVGLLFIVAAVMIVVIFGVMHSIAALVKWAWRPNAGKKRRFW